MRTLLLATVVILAMRTLILATASSMVMATAGTVFAERASTTFQKLAIATQFERRRDPQDAMAQADGSQQAPHVAVALALRPYGALGVRLAQGEHQPAVSSRMSAV